MARPQAQRSHPYRSTRVVSLSHCVPQYNVPMKQSTLPIIIEHDAEAFYVSCPPLQGCYSQGDTYDKALSNIEDAIRLHLEDRQADHDELAVMV